MRLVRTARAPSDLVHLVSYLLSMIFFFGLECVVGLDIHGFGSVDSTKF